MHSCEPRHIHYASNQLNLKWKQTKRQTSREAGTQSQRVSLRDGRATERQDNGTTPPPS